MTSYSQSSRIGQRADSDLLRIPFHTTASMPEAAWDGLMVWLTDESTLVVYSEAEGSWQTIDADAFGGQGANVYLQPEPPTLAEYALKRGDLWMDSDNGRKLHVYENGQWEPYTDPKINEVEDKLDNVPWGARLWVPGMWPQNSFVVHPEGTSWRALRATGTEPPAAREVGPDRGPRPVETPVDPDPGDGGGTPVPGALGLMPEFTSDRWMWVDWTTTAEDAGGLQGIGGQLVHDADNATLFAKDELSQSSYAALHMAQLADFAGTELTYHVYTDFTQTAGLSTPERQSPWAVLAMIDSVSGHADGLIIPLFDDGTWATGQLGGTNAPAGGWTQITLKFHLFGTGVLRVTVLRDGVESGQYLSNDVRYTLMGEFPAEPGPNDHGSLLGFDTFQFGPLHCEGVLSGSVAMMRAPVVQGRMMMTAQEPSSPFTALAQMVGFHREASDD